MVAPLAGCSVSVPYHRLQWINGGEYLCVLQCVHVCMCVCVQYFGLYFNSYVEVLR